MLGKDVLNVAKFPTATFQIKSALPAKAPAGSKASHFQLDGKYFVALDEEGQRVKPVKGLAKPDRVSVLTALESDVLTS